MKIALSIEISYIFKIVRDYIYACAELFWLEKEIFIETEDYIKEALFAVCLWLRDHAEIRAEGKLLSAFSSLSRGENLVERTVNAFMRAEKRKRRIVKNEHKNKT